MIDKYFHYALAAMLISLFLIVMVCGMLYVAGSNGASTWGVVTSVEKVISKE